MEQCEKERAISCLITDKEYELLTKLLEEIEKNN